MTGDSFYAPPGRARSWRLLRDDENDKQAEIMKGLADALARAELSKGDNTVDAWAEVARVQVVLRKIASELEAKDEG